MGIRYDCIVIGTGIAGLSAAAHLSRSGLGVLVIGSGDKVGGIHAPVEVPGRGSFGEAFGRFAEDGLHDSALGVLGVELSLVPDVVTEVSVPVRGERRRLTLYKTPENLVFEFWREFPPEIWEIERFLRRMERYESRLWRKEGGNLIHSLGNGGAPWGTLGSRLIPHLPSNPDFRNLISALFKGVLGLDLKSSSLLDGVALFNLLWRDIQYIEGGIPALLGGLSRAIERSGGEVRLGVRVDGIIGRGGRAEGAAVEGEPIFGRHIIANIQPREVPFSILIRAPKWQMRDGRPRRIVFLDDPRFGLNDGNLCTMYIPPRSGPRDERVITITTPTLPGDGSTTPDFRASSLRAKVMNRLSDLLAEAGEWEILGNSVPQRSADWPTERDLLSSRMKNLSIIPDDLPVDFALRRGVDTARRIIEAWRGTEFHL
ncbi:MAG: phytoene desaturase family protein [bacterium]